MKSLEVHIKRLLLDRGFDNNAVIGYLKEQSFPTIIALTIRGKTGGTRALLKGRKSYVTTYTRHSTIYPTETFAVHVACKYAKGRYKRQGLCRFAYIVIGKLNLHPLQIYHEYRLRFGIETSYRLMNLVRARTTSKSSTLRLLYVGVALTMLNLWVFVKWTASLAPGGALARCSITCFPWRGGGSGSGKSSNSAKDSTWKLWSRQPHDCGLLIMALEAQHAFDGDEPPSPGGQSKGGAHGAGGTAVLDPGRVSERDSLASGCSPLVVYPIG